MTLPATGVTRLVTPPGASWCAFPPGAYVQLPEIAPGKVILLNENFSGHALDARAPTTNSEFQVEAAFEARTEMLGRVFEQGAHTVHFTIQYGLALRGVILPRTAEVGGPLVPLRIRVFNKSTVAKGMDAAADRIVVRLRCGPHLVPCLTFSDDNRSAAIATSTGSSAPQLKSGRESVTVMLDGTYERMYDADKHTYEIVITRIDRQTQLEVVVPIYIAASAPMFGPLVVQADLLHRGRVIQYDQTSVRAVPGYHPPTAAAPAPAAATPPIGRTLLITTLEMTRARYLLWHALLRSLKMASSFDVYDLDLYDGVLNVVPTTTATAAKRATTTAAATAAAADKDDDNDEEDDDDGGEAGAAESTTKTRAAALSPVAASAHVRGNKTAPGPAATEIPEVRLALYGPGSAIVAPYGPVGTDKNMPWTQLLQWAAASPSEVMLVVGGDVAASTTLLHMAADTIGRLVPPEQAGHYGGTHLLRPSAAVAERRAHGLIKKARRHAPLDQLNGVWVTQASYHPVRRRLILFTYGTCMVYQLPLHTNDPVATPPPADNPHSGTAALDIDADQFPYSAVPVGALPLASSYAQFALGLMAVLPMRALMHLLLEAAALPDLLNLWSPQLTTSDAAVDALAVPGASDERRGAGGQSGSSAALLGAQRGGRRRGTSTSTTSSLALATHHPSAVLAADAPSPTTIARWIWVLANGARLDTAALVLVCLRDRVAHELVTCPVAELPTIAGIVAALKPPIPERKRALPVVVAMLVYVQTTLSADAAVMQSKLDRRKWRRNLTAEVRAARLDLLARKLSWASAQLSALHTNPPPEAHPGRLWADQLPRLPQLLAALQRPLQAPSPYAYTP
jgi:hypothetical protein